VAVNEHRDRALLIDLDGVLRRWPPDLARRAERAAGLPVGAIHAAAFEPALLARAVTGAIDDAAWRSEATLRLARGRSLLTALQAMAAWSASPGTVDASVRALLARARRRARVVLVTNATDRLDADLRALGLADELDAVVNSSAIGYAKPDARILQAARLAGGAPAARSLFVDDTPEHVAAAVALGMRGHVFVGATDLERALRDGALLDAAPHAGAEDGAPPP
jgi:putative hydrolase of the HAD superfamily